MSNSAPPYPRATPDSNGPPPSFGGLRAIWRGIKRFAAIFMMACVGGWICGAGAGAATFYCYGIGGWLGLPLGMVGGAFLGAKTPARRATLTFTTGAYTAWALYHAAQRLNWDNILVAALSLIGASLAMLVVYALERLLPERVSFWAAVTSAVIFSIWMMVDFAHWLTTTQ